MLLRLLREGSERHVTFGRLFVDYVFECLTLEDEVRERPGEPVSAWKVPWRIAISVGARSARTAQDKSGHTPDVRSTSAVRKSASKIPTFYDERRDRPAACGF
jgi:hypothetical protein